MAEEIIISGKTFEAAMAEAQSKYAGENVQYEILEMPRRGIFGIGASPAKIKVIINEPEEDEADLSKVNFDINLFDLYAKGFIEGVNGGLTETEIDFLPESAIMMTFECGMRFLADYLNGDTYFRTHRPGQNLDRARNQFKLVSDMEKALPEMHKIVNKYKESKNA